MPKKKLKTAQFEPPQLSAMLWCRATPELVEQVDSIAEKEDRKRSVVVRRLLLRALAQNEKTA